MANPKPQSGNLRLVANDKTIFDASGCSISFSRETKERAATKDTKSGASTKSTKNWTTGYDGLVDYASDGSGGYDFKELHDIFNDDTDALVKVELIPDEADYKWYGQGTGIITALDGNWAVDEDGKATMSIKGVGDWVWVDKAVTPPVSAS